jgi:hypothetical protein
MSLFMAAGFATGGPPRETPARSRRESGATTASIAAVPVTLTERR